MKTLFDILAEHENRTGEFIDPRDYPTLLWGDMEEDEKEDKLRKLEEELKGN